MPKAQFLDIGEIVRSALKGQHEKADISLLVRNLRARATEALALAENMHSSRTRQTMRGVAATYEELAQRLEQHVENRDQ